MSLKAHALSRSKQILKYLVEIPNILQYYYWFNLIKKRSYFHQLLAHNSFHTVKITVFNPTASFIQHCLMLHYTANALKKYARWGLWWKWYVLIFNKRLLQLLRYCFHNHNELKHQNWAIRLSVALHLLYFHHLAFWW